jgi:hypothetical protein
MTQKPERPDQNEASEKPPAPRRDLAGWYPLVLQYEAGTSAQEIADRAGVARHSLYLAAGKLRAQSAAKLAKVRETALRRRRLLAEAELLIGDPARAVKVLNGYAALRRAEREERISEMETRNAAKPGENKEAKLSDAEVDLLRADLRRRLFPGEPETGAKGEVRAAGRDGADPAQG